MCILSLLYSLRSYLHHTCPFSQQMTLLLFSETNIRGPLTCLLPAFWFCIRPSHSLNTEVEPSQGRSFRPPEFTNVLHFHLSCWMIPSQIFILSLHWPISLNVERQGWQTLLWVYQQPCPTLPEKAISSRHKSSPSAGE